MESFFLSEFMQWRTKNQELMPYFEKMDSILETPYTSYHKNKTASKIFDHLYISSVYDATNIELIHELGVTHVINCCAADACTTLDLYAETEVRSLIKFNAMDSDYYDILQHFDEAFATIENARTTGGVALIHCQAGVNRSGALAVAYVIAYSECGPISAVRRVLKVRRVLSNRGFSDQLILFAKERDLLHLDSKEIL